MFLIELRDACRKEGSLRKVAFMVSCLFVLAVASCDSSKQTEAGQSSSQPESKVTEPETAVQPEKPAIPALSEIDLGQIERMAAVVRVSGQPDRQGILFHGGSSEKVERFW